MNLPEHLTQDDGTATLDMFELGTMFPWFVLKKSDGTVLLIRLKNFAGTILDTAKPYQFDVSFCLITLPDSSLNQRRNNTFMKDINSYTGQFEWDGTTARLYVKNAVFTKRLLFKGQ